MTSWAFIIYFIDLYGPLLHLIELDYVIEGEGTWMEVGTVTLLGGLQRVGEMRKWTDF
jgi:hypothetical protein